MLLLGIKQSHRDNLKMLASDMSIHSDRKRKQTTLPVESEISLYENDFYLRSRMDSVIQHYFALSIVTLEKMSDRYHSDGNAKFDRCMSGHESLIHKRLSENHEMHCLRQLLIGSSHSDIYIPRLHLCIEPSSEKYFSSPARARAEALSDHERFRMNELWSWRTERYESTRQDLTRTLDNLVLTRKPLTSDEVKNNFYIIACHTLPRFISYRDFSSLIRNTPSNFHEKNYRNIF